MSYDAEATARFEERWEARLVRVDTHLERIANTAYRFGRQLSRHEITRADVDRRLDALCTQCDAEVDDFMVALAPWDMARDAAIAGLRRGIEATR